MVLDVLRQLVHRDMVCRRCQPKLPARHQPQQSAKPRTVRAFTPRHAGWQLSVHFKNNAAAVAAPGVCHGKNHQGLKLCATVFPAPSGGGLGRGPAVAVPVGMAMTRPYPNPPPEGAGAHVTNLGNINKRDMFSVPSYLCLKPFDKTPATPPRPAARRRTNGPATTQLGHAAVGWLGRPTSHTPTSR
jgi:hypothetical protein